MTFHYKAIRPSGEAIEGQMDAADKSAVIARLNELGYIPIRAETRKSAGGVSLDFDLSKLFRPALSRHDVVVLTRELATLLGARLPIDRALRVITELGARGPLRALLTDLHERIVRGGTFSDALSAHPAVFPRSYVSMVRAGEAGGTLETILASIADHQERMSALRETVRAALIYPIILMSGVVITIALMFVVVLPMFEGVFEEAGARLPAFTVLLLGVGQWVQSYGWVLPLLGLLAFLWARIRLRSPAGRLWLHTRMLRLPLIGDFVKNTETVRFSRTLGTLMANGVDTLNALAITKDTLSNVVMRDGVQDVVNSLKKGQLIAGPLQSRGFLPPLAIQLIAIGEESGQLEPMLAKVAEIFERELQVRIGRALALLTPVLTLGIGLFVAIVIGTILSALLSVYSLPL